MKYNLGKKALVLSVPGTGTRFTRQLLEKCFGYTPVGIDQIVGKPVESRFFTFHHVDGEPWKRITENHHEIKTVIPLRSPVAQYITRWQEMSRGAPRGVKGAAISRATAIQLWKWLAESLEKYNYVFLPIEAGFDRKELIWRVANHLEVLPDADEMERFCREWPKVGTAGPRAEREEYDANGEVKINGYGMGFLDAPMKWYGELIEQYGAAA